MLITNDFVCFKQFCYFTTVEIVGMVKFYCQNQKSLLVYHFFDSVVKDDALKIIDVFNRNISKDSLQTTLVFFDDSAFLKDFEVLKIFVDFADENRAIVKELYFCNFNIVQEVFLTLFLKLAGGKLPYQKIKNITIFEKNLEVKYPDDFTFLA
jgi:hypothetical protein